MVTKSRRASRHLALLRSKTEQMQEGRGSIMAASEAVFEEEQSNSGSGNLSMQWFVYHKTRKESFIG